MKTPNCFQLMLLLGAVQAASAQPLAFEPIEWWQKAYEERGKQYSLAQPPLALSPEDPPRLLVQLYPVGRLETPGLFVSNADGTGLGSLAPPGDPTHAAEWSPNGRYIACSTFGYENQRLSRASLWVIDVVSGKRWQVCSEVAGPFRWLPDSRGLLYWQRLPVLPEGETRPREGWRWQAYRAEALWDTVKPQPPSLPVLRTYGPLVAPFSPDGRSVAFWAFMHPDSRADANWLMIADVETGAVRSHKAPSGPPPGGLPEYPGLPMHLKELQWSPDSRKVSLALIATFMESSHEQRFVVDAQTGAYQPAPLGLGQYLAPLQAGPWPPHEDPQDEPRPRPAEADIRGWLWQPGTHSLLLALTDPRPTYAMAPGAHNWKPQYEAWVLWDTDSGAISPVQGLPALKQSLLGPRLSMFDDTFGRWSGRYLSVNQDYPRLYRMR